MADHSKALAEASAFLKMHDPAQRQPEESEYTDETDALVGPAWSIQNLPSADWALLRTAELEQEIAENEALAAAAIQRIEERLRKLNDQAMRGVAFFRQRLLEYANGHREELLKGGKKKTRAMVHGSIAWRKVGGRLKMEDREALLAWAQKQPIELGLVRFREEPALDPIWAYAKEKNLIPPGCFAVPEEDEIKIEASTLSLTKEG